MTRWWQAARFSLHGLAFGVCVTSIAACQSPEVRGTALYPPGPPRGRGEIALLQGPIESVDGRNVGALNPVFELLPGCHVIEIGERLGLIGERESLSALANRRVYALRMRAGHTYTIDVPRASANVGAPLSTTVVAREEDRNGHVAFVSPALSSADVVACRQWLP